MKETKPYPFDLSVCGSRIILQSLQEDKTQRMRISHLFFFYFPATMHISHQEQYFKVMLSQPNCSLEDRVVNSLRERLL